LNIQLIESKAAQKGCQTITETLPEWFGIPEANEY